MSSISITTHHDESVLPTSPTGDALYPVQLQVPPYFVRKKILMRILGGILLIAFSPLIALCMFLVRLTSAGPALYWQTRVGKDNLPFQICKIRTMYIDSEDLSGPVLCRPKDSRVTPVGKVLRFLHLDELPQLINVVRGEMCLVGPRPERPEIISKHELSIKVPGFHERTKVLPGVTGLAQINLPADLTAECVIPKVQLDLGYISTATPGLDFRILLCTALRMIGVRHGHAVRMLGLSRRVNLGHSTQQESGNSSGHMTKNPWFRKARKQVVRRPARPAVVALSEVTDISDTWTESSTSNFEKHGKSEHATASLPRNPR